MPNPWRDGDEVTWANGTMSGVVQSQEASHPTQDGDVLIPVRCLVDGSVVLNSQKQSQVEVMIAVPWWELSS